MGHLKNYRIVFFVDFFFYFRYAILIARAEEYNKHFCKKPLRR